MLGPCGTLTSHAVLDSAPAMCNCRWRRDELGLGQLKREQLMPEEREQRIQEKLQREKEKEEAAADAAKKAKTFGAGSLRARRTGRPDSRSS